MTIFSFLSCLSTSSSGSDYGSWNSDCVRAQWKLYSKWQCLLFSETYHHPMDAPIPVIFIITILWNSTTTIIKSCLLTSVRTYSALPNECVYVNAVSNNISEKQIKAYIEWNESIAKVLFFLVRKGEVINAKLRLHGKIFVCVIMCSVYQWFFMGLDDFLYQRVLLVIVLVHPCAVIDNCSYLCYCKIKKHKHPKNYLLQLPVSHKGLFFWE